jgi:nucleoid-associated protein EbfC
MTNQEPAMQDLVSGLQAAQKNLLLARRELEEAEVTGSAGGGDVTVVMRGTGEVTSVRFAQSAIDKGDADSLAALTLTALQQAMEAIRSLADNRLSAVTGGLQSSLTARQRPGHPYSP